MLRLRTFGGLSIENAASVGAAMPNRRPLALLALLAVNGGRGVSRDAIVALLWPESEPERARNSLSQASSLLRRELAVDDPLLGTTELRLNRDVLACDVIEFEQHIAADDLESIRARMTLLPDVPSAVSRRVSSAVSPLAAARAQPVHDGAVRDEPAQSVGIETGRPRRIRWTMASGFVATMVTVALVTAALLWQPKGSSEPVGQITRLAILPLVNSTGDTTVNAVADALSEELISILLRQGVRVVGYYSVAKYRGTSIPLSQIGRQLDVDAVATWAVRRQGDQLQVSLEVARPKSGEGVWASTKYVVDALQLPDVAADAARELVKRLAPRDAATHRTPVLTASTSPEAKTAYFIGMQSYYKGAGGFEFALRQFQRAIAADSNFAPAWAGLGIVYAWAIDYSLLPLKDACAKALPAIQRALFLDAELALTHLARARTLQHCDWNWKEAEAEYRTAIALEPSVIAYQSYGWPLEWYLGRTGEGVAMGDTAVALDPGSALTHSALAWRLRGAGQLSRAESEAHIANALDPAAIDGHWVLAEVYLRRGDYAAAEREALEVKARSSRPADWTTLGEI